MEDERIKRIENNIIKLFNGTHTKEGSYMLPWSHDGSRKYKISYRISKANLWKTKSAVRCVYSGMIFITLDIKVTDEGRWVKMSHITDLPEWIGNDLQDEILDELESYFTNVCVDIEYI
jgi:hypothetical protein